MSKELDYWRHISRCEVPGLTIALSMIESGGYNLNVDHAQSNVSVLEPSPPQRHRAAAMLVVDALEAAGIAWFDRLVLLEDSGWHVSGPNTPEYDYVTFEEHDGKEHLALLALLADVAEAHCPADGGK